MHVLSLESINHIFELPIECNIQWLDRTCATWRDKHNFCLALSFQFVHNCSGLLCLVNISNEELRTLCFGSRRSSPHVGNPVVHDGFITPGILLELDINTPGLSVKFSNPFPEKYEGA